MRKQCVPGVSPPPSQTPGYEATLDRALQALYAGILVTAWDPCFWKELDTCSTKYQVGRSLCMINSGHNSNTNPQVAAVRALACRVHRALSILSD